LIDWSALPFDRTHLEVYLQSLYRCPVRVTRIRELGDSEDEERVKEYGYGVPLLIELDCDGVEDRLVFHTMSENPFGHERRSDRARNLLLDYATFNRLPQHVEALDVGTLDAGGDLVSLGETGEFFLLTRYAPGRLYALDLKRIARVGVLQPGDEERCRALADYLARIHALKGGKPLLYRRRIRDLLGHGEGVMGMMDAYPPDFELAPRERLREIEQRCVDWRWRIKDSDQRLSQVHGDFHPWNVLFQDEGTGFFLLDRSRGEWGEPADDVTAMTINYILFSLRQTGALQGPFHRLYRLFWQRYLERTGDSEILRFAQPFYAWRALVVAHPVWYPNLERSVREALFHFIENVLATERFDPDRTGIYIQ